MLILEIITIFITLKYLPKVKEKINYEYEEKFNIKIFSKENFKIPFWGSILIVTGVLYRGFTTNHIFGLILSTIGGIMVLYAIILCIKKQIPYMDQ